MIEDLPPYMFLTAFSQLVSRICHPHPDVFKHLKTIIAYMLLVYPQQSLWMLMPVYKSSSMFRAKRCEDVLNDPIFRNTKNMKLLNDFTRLTEKLIELTEKPIGTDVRNITVSTLVSSLPRLLKSPDFSDIMMPCQQFTVIQLPTDENRIIGHDPFPAKQVFIKEICDELTVLPSLQKPRRISFIGSDGNQYMMMCKAKDDLRKDFRFMEFNNVVNRYLRKDPESRQRGLYIRTYTYQTPILQSERNLNDFCSPNIHQYLMSGSDSPFRSLMLGIMLAHLTFARQLSCTWWAICLD